jgi:signal transduction histidine kinase
MAFNSAFALILSILLAMGWLSYREMTAASEADLWETHAYLVIDELTELLSSIKDAETEQRGYIITGDQEHLVPYRASLGEIESHLAELRRLTADNRRQQQRLAAVTQLVAAKLAKLKETIAVRDTKGFQAAKEMIQAEMGKNMEGLRALVGQAQQEEQQRLQDRTTAKVTETRTAIHLIVLSGAAGSLMLSLMAYHLKVELARRRRTESELRAHKDRLTELVDARTQDLRKAVNTLETEITERYRLEREILEISEREQSRLGQDIHDGLGQELAGISMLASVLAKDLQAESPLLANSATRISTYIRNAIGTTRQIARGLYPIGLSHGLALALEDLAKLTSERFNISCNVRQIGEVLMLAQSANIHMYRIVQECIGNAIKHGQARHITIELRADNGAHTVTVIDDGIGFEKPAASSGMGLHVMDYRARVIGAEIEISKPAEGGCRVTCKFSRGHRG